MSRIDIVPADRLSTVQEYYFSRKLKEVTAYAPMDRILLETDCPYLAPVPNRGKRNSSLYLPAAAEAIAAIKGISAEDVIRITWDNAVRMYGLTVPAL